MSVACRSFAAAVLLALASVTGCAGEGVGSDAIAQPPETSNAASETATSDDDDRSSGTSAPTAAKSTDLYVRTFGDRSKQAVVFLHGGPGANSYGFESSVAQAIADRGYFVVAYDQRGCGRSPLATVADYRYATFTADLDGVIESLALERPVLLPHSFGGSIALRYTEAHPEVVKGIILAGSPLHFPATYRTIIDHAAAAYRKGLAFGKAKELEELGQRMFPHGATGPFTYTADDIVVLTHAMVEAGIALPGIPSPSAVKLMAKMMAGPDRGLTNAINEELGKGFQLNDQVGYLDFMPLVETHKELVYAAYGDEDGIFDEAQLGALERTIGASHFAIIHGASHFSYIDQSDAFVEVVTRHLAAITAP